MPDHNIYIKDIVRNWESSVPGIKRGEVLDRLYQILRSQKGDPKFYAYIDGNSEKIDISPQEICEALKSWKDNGKPPEITYHLILEYWTKPFSCLISHLRIDKRWADRRFKEEFPDHDSRPQRRDQQKKEELQEVFEYVINKGEEPSLAEILRRIEKQSDFKPPLKTGARDFRLEEVKATKKTQALLKYRQDGKPYLEPSYGVGMAHELVWRCNGEDRRCAVGRSLDKYRSDALGKRIEN